MKRTFILCLFALGCMACQPGEQFSTWLSTTDEGSSVLSGKTLSATGTNKLSHSVSKENLSSPEKLFVGGIDAVQTILKAEEKYKREHGHYTSNIQDLNLTFNNLREQYLVNNTSRIYLKNGIYYVLTDKLVAVYFDNPTELSQLYHLDFYFDGDQQCIAKAPPARATCEQLGGTNPRPNSRIQSWIIYDLSDDFLQ